MLILPTTVDNHLVEVMAAVDVAAVDAEVVDVLEVVIEAAVAEEEAVDALEAGIEVVVVEEAEVVILYTRRVEVLLILLVKRSRFDSADRAKK